MNPFVLGGLLSGVGSLASGLWNTFTGQSQSKDLMKYQYELQQQAIDKQNWYNSPEQQMLRLKSAGLSPNLVYGSGVDGNQSSAASPSIANRHGEMGNPLQDAAQQTLQAQQVQKQLELAEIDTRTKAFESLERRHKLQAETLGQMLDNKYNSRAMETRIKQLSQNLVNSMQQEQNLVANEAYTWSRTRNEDNRLKQIWADTELIKSKTKLTNEQALTESVRRAALNAGISLTRAQVAQVGSYIDFLEAGTTLRHDQHDWQLTERKAREVYLKWRAAHPKTALTFDMLKEVLGIGQQGMSLIPGI